MRSLEISGFLRVRFCGGAGTASNLPRRRGRPWPYEDEPPPKAGAPFQDAAREARHGVVHKKRRARRKFEKPLCRSGFFHRSSGASGLETRSPCATGVSCIDQRHRYGPVAEVPAPVGSVSSQPAEVTTTLSVVSHARQVVDWQNAT
jgi:hypothetical protein